MYEQLVAVLYGVWYRMVRRKRFGRKLWPRIYRERLRLDCYFNSAFEFLGYICDLRYSIEIQQQIHNRSFES